MSPPTINDQNGVAQTLLKLSKVSHGLQQDMEETAELHTPLDWDEDIENEDSPRFLLFVLDQAEPTVTCKRLTNFAVNEFETLHDNVHDAIIFGMFSKRGRRCAESPKDMLFMLLVLLRHGGEWSFFAEILKKIILRLKN